MFTPVKIQILIIWKQIQEKLITNSGNCINMFDNESSMQAYFSLRLGKYCGRICIVPLEFNMLNVNLSWEKIIPQLLGVEYNYVLYKCDILSTW